MLKLFRSFRLVYVSPCRDVNRGVVVCVGHMATQTAFKLGLALTIGFIAMTTLATGSAGVARINGYHWDTVQLSLVFEKAPQLKKRPATHLCSLTTPEPGSGPDACQVFQGNASASVFGVSNELFAYNVVLVAAEPPLFVADPLHRLASVAPGGSFARHFLTQGPPYVLVLLTHRFYARAGNVMPVAGVDDPSHAHIDADKLFDFDGSLVGQVDRTVKVKLPIAIYQITLTLKPIKPLSLIFAKDDRDNLATLQGEQAYAIHALEAHQSLIIGHGPVRLKLRAFGLIPPETLDGLSDGPHCHLARQTEAIPQFAITPFVHARLAEYPGVETHAGRV